MQKRTKIFDITGEYDAPHRNCQLIDQTINHTTMTHVVLDMFDIEMLVKREAIEELS